MAEEQETQMPQEAQMASAEAENSSPASAENLRVLENIDVMLSVAVGNTELKIRDLLRLNEGSVIELDRLAGTSTWSCLWFTLTAMDRPATSTVAFCPMTPAGSSSTNSGSPGRGTRPRKR